eukprot:NODE_2_length_91304_cov_0.692462.p22 type:complete len:383 gc:universal NODE_2_length_91304_cov_0.692462:61282-60134(-)
MLSYKLSYKTTALSNAFRKRNWEEKQAEDSKFDVFWSDVTWVYQELDKNPLQKHQKINHFRNNYELTKKDLLAKNLKLYWKKSNPFESFYSTNNIVPASFIVPSEYFLFVDMFKKSPDRKWILKPSGKSQGKGIQLVTKLSTVAIQYKKCRKFMELSFAEREKLESQEMESFIVQEYIANPLLIGNRKFDLRLYVLVMSFSPLVVYVHQLGFCRFSQSFYTTDFSNLAVHATNVSIQKNQADYDKNIGCKWNLNKLRIYVMAKFGMQACCDLFLNIEKTILISLFSVQSRIIQSSNCFELYGYDILLDSNLKPWLIEVNASPSLSVENQEDLDIKSKVLSDMLDLLGLDPKVETYSGFQLIFNNGFIKSDENYKSKLGMALK